MTITPDGKDWTWVLGERCPECGFDARSVPAASVAARVRATVPLWRAALAAPDVANRPSPDTWSPLEYACHVRDVHRLYTYRLGLMLEQDDPLFPNWDQDETAIEERYGEQDPAVVSSELQAAGETLVQAFAAVEADQWARTGRRSDGAAFTVATFARYLLHDPTHHLHDVQGAAAGVGTPGMG